MADLTKLVKEACCIVKEVKVIGLYSVKGRGQYVLIEYGEQTKELPIKNISTSERKILAYFIAEFDHFKHLVNRAKNETP